MKSIPFESNNISENSIIFNKQYTLDGLKEISEKIIEYLEKITIITFEGEMGSGKTTLIKEICKSLNVTDTVSSPTFSIVNEYKTIQGNSIFHFDFYRINSEIEALDMGYEEYFYSDNLCLIEWPSKISVLLPISRMNIKLEATNENYRHILIEKIESR